VKIKTYSQLTIAFLLQRIRQEGATKELVELLNRELVEQPSETKTRTR